MKTRRFGAEELDVSEVGLGCWQIGGAWGEVTDEQARQILRTALDEGVTFFDTADVYGAGRSETLIGSHVPVKDPRIFIATKLGRLEPPGWPENFSLETMRKHTEDSLTRLKVEALDLTQLHCLPAEEYRKGEVFENLRTLQKEGKIKRFGASVESMAEAQLCLEQEGLASLQIIFNIFRQKPIDELFAQAKAKNVAIIVRLPLASGLLAGKFTRGTQFAADDHRNFNRDGQMFNVGETFAGLPFETGVDLANELSPLVPEEMSMAQWAIRWILDHDAVTTVIPGASRPGQVESNARVSELPPLRDRTHRQLRAFYREKVHDNIRGPY